MRSWNDTFRHWRLEVKSLANLDKQMLKDMLIVFTAAVYRLHEVSRILSENPGIILSKTVFGWNEPSKGI